MIGRLRSIKAKRSKKILFRSLPAMSVFVHVFHLSRISMFYIHYCTPYSKHKTNIRVLCSYRATSYRQSLDGKKKKRLKDFGLPI